MPATEDVWEVLEHAPEYAEGVSDLCHWSTNYDSPTPWQLFLDMIGWSEDQLGEPMFDLSKVSERFGYLEIGKFAAALNEYADRPTDVREYVERIMAAEG